MFRLCKNAPAIKTTAVLISFEIHTVHNIKQKKIKGASTVVVVAFFLFFRCMLTANTEYLRFPPYAFFQEKKNTKG